MVFALPGFTPDVFPNTKPVCMPGVCDSVITCNEALQRARGELGKEYNAKVIAMWSNAPPVLITRDKPVRKLEDLEGLELRVVAKASVPAVGALGAQAVAQPITVVNQNLANGVIDGIITDPSAIRSFKLHEPANYVTTWFLGSGSAFVLLMNKDVYNGLSAEEKGWVDAAASTELSLGAGQAYHRVSGGGLKIAQDAGNELIEFSDAKKARFQARIDDVMREIRKQKVGDSTVGDMMAKMTGKGS